MKIEGRYFERKELEAGTMGTANVQKNDIHYFVRETGNGNMSLEMVNRNGASSGIEVDVISKEEFAMRFKPCMEHDCSFRVKTPEELKQNKLKQIEDVAEEHLKKKEFVSAEFEFGRALKVDEDSVRANYGMGKVFLETGEVEKAKKIFNKLSKIEALFEEENKHIFNEFGIDLRKHGMFEEAIANYKKAISIAPEDKILYYNLGRAYKEKGDLKSASLNAKKALEIDPDFTEAKEYYNFLTSRLT